MKIIQFSFDADIVKTSHKVKKDKKIEEGDHIIEGYVMTSDIDSQGTIITNEAIKRSKNDLLKYSTVLFNHDRNRPIGKILETDFDKKGLWVKMKLSRSEWDIWEKVQEGIISKFSINGRIVKSSFVEKGKKGKTKKNRIIPFDKLIRKIDRLELYEASLVSVPANVRAKAINWYIQKSLDLAEKKQSKGKVVIKKKIINNTIKKEIIKELESLVNELKNKDAKNIINKTIHILKQSKHKKKVLGLSDKSDNIYEVNNSDIIELDGNKFRKQLLKTGQWYHWDAEGGILDITKKAIGNIVKNFEKKTIEHVYVPLTHSTNPSKNTGEVTKLIQTEDGLDAICEIKDEKVVKKIKDGLIKCVSASIDEDYMNKKSGKQVGPTLLHAALVAEPYIKGMSGFTELSENSCKKVISLSDTKPTIKDMINLLKNDLKKLDKKVKLKKKNKKESKKMKKIKKKVKKVIKKIKKSAYTKCIGREMKDGKTMKEAAKICKKEAPKETKKKIEKKVEIKKTKNKVMKKIKKSKMIKKDNKVKVKSLEDKISKALGVKSKAKLKNRSKAVVSKKVDLAEAERVYSMYLEKGKVVPAQRDTIISLLTSKSAVNLGDDQVDVKKVLTSFLDKQPKIVDFEEKGTQETTKPKMKKAKGVPQDVKEFYGNMGLDKKQTREAWKFAKESADKAKEDKSTLF